MRNLIGKLPTKEPNITKSVYLAELVNCRECERTVPVGIEIITHKNVGGSREVLKHEYFCRAHGMDYEMKVQTLPITPKYQRRKVA